ncbi:hypothetical protein OG444_26950 [Streptomyces sp. NBC_01232]|uniref:hypothetical protein n=1 Tax=Streptomyces sp. NBC_01232 TaxID=2903786 RepID=UPI002E12CC49|nr:hypothetical protein OG444_26950 [Streptomyces sp. NBC_01232]
MGAVLCGLAVAALTAGCGAPGPQPGRGIVHGAPPDTRTRMEQVAAAWADSAVVRRWREGFHPLDPQDWQPPGGFRSGEDKAAHAAGNFVLRTGLPDALPPATAVQWPDGSTLTLPLRTAAQAYGEIDRVPDRAPDRDQALAVTAVRFGGTTVRTSRGPARVPAWLFTVEGYDTPLARIAVAPQEAVTPPIVPVDDPDGTTARLFGHRSAPEATTLRVSASHGSCDAGVAVDVLESAGTVVLAGRILSGAPGPGVVACDAMLRVQTVQVALSRPVGGRIVVDATTGGALEQTGDN